MGWVTSSGSLGWTNAMEAMEGLDGNQSDDGFFGDVQSWGGTIIWWL